MGSNRRIAESDARRVKREWVAAKCDGCRVDFGLRANPTGLCHERPDVAASEERTVRELVIVRAGSRKWGRTAKRPISRENHRERGEAPEPGAINRERAPRVSSRRGDSAAWRDGRPREARARHCGRTGWSARQCGAAAAAASLSTPLHRRTAARLPRSRSVGQSFAPAIQGPKAGELSSRASRASESIGIALESRHSGRRAQSAFERIGLQRPGPA
jgi:hypothetical protein